VLLETDNCVAQVARIMRAARSSVQYGRSLYDDFGERGVVPLRRGRNDWKVSDDAFNSLLELLQSRPAEHGYLRSRWSSELLALQLRVVTGVEVHATTVRRWLKQLNYGYRRARPTLCIRDARKVERMKAIERALDDESPFTEVFYSDEADVDLNPRIGSAWYPKCHSHSGEKSNATPHRCLQREQRQGDMGRR
jgi:transposase